MTTRFRGTLLAGIVTALCACSGGGGGDKGGGGTTSPTSSIPVSVSKQAGDAQTGVVGATISAPVVKVLNFSGAGVSGVVVNFTASNGDVLGATTVTTGADGTASAGSWRLSTVAGTHTVSASATGVALAASFSATVRADVARSMIKSAGDNQTGFAGSTVTTPPAVTVADQFGNPVSGTSVTYAVSTGGGSLTGATATSNANGIAAVGAWRLGAAVGSNTLVASSTGLPAVTFTATGISDPCNTFLPITLGQTLSGTLSATDCIFADDYYADVYSFTTTGTQLVQMDLTSSAFRPYLDVFNLADDYLGFDTDSSGGTLARLRLLGPPGEYVAVANSFLERSTGAYTFGLSTWGGDIGGCETDVWIVPSNTPYNQTISNTDCSGTSTAGTTYADGVFFWVDAGRTYTFTMASTAVDPTLLIRGFNFSTGTFGTVGTDDNSGGGTTARVTWTPTVSTFGIIFASTAAVSSTGAYALTFARSGTAALRAPTTLQLAKARAARRLAFGGAGALSAFLPAPGQTAVRAARRP
jgi:hypothetical protein